MASNPYAGIAEEIAIGQKSSAESSCLIAEVTDVEPSGDDRNTGVLLSAALGDLPLYEEDIVFLRHTSGNVSIGEQLLMIAAEDGQLFYCIGRLP